jgi:hypothetical protein
MQQQLLSQAEADFQAAVERWHRASTELERAAIAIELDRCRSVLILQYGFSLQELCELVDNTNELFRQAHVLDGGKGLVRRRH